MNGVVVFDPNWFIAVYPEFTNVPSATLSTYFTLATTLCDNTACSPIQDASPPGVRAVALNCLVAHFAALAGLGTNNSERQGLVGRISNASQGSVSVAVDMPSSPDAAWYNQTQYGATFWATTARYRMGRYVPYCGRRASAAYPGFPYPGFPYPGCQ